MGTRSVAAFCITAFALTACAPNYVLWNGADYPPNAIRASLGRLQIMDSRPPPAMSLVKDDSDVIIGEVKRNLAGEAGELDFDVQILEANVVEKSIGIRPAWSGKFKLKIWVSGAGPQTYCIGDVALQRSGGLYLSGKPVAEKLLQEGLLLGTYKCLETWKKEINQAPAKRPRI